VWKIAGATRVRSLMTLSALAATQDAVEFLDFFDFRVSAIAYTKAMRSIGGHIWRTIAAIELKFSMHVQVDMLYNCDEFRCDNFRN
jgi:hypothetical protein